MTREEWKAIGVSNGWRMPRISWWRRLPIIRHAIATYYSIQIEAWYSAVPGIRTGYDEWVLFGLFWGYKDD